MTLTAMIPPIYEAMNEVCREWASKRKFIPGLCEGARETLKTMVLQEIVTESDPPVLGIAEAMRRILARIPDGDKSLKFALNMSPPELAEDWMTVVDPRTAAVVHFAKTPTDIIIAVGLTQEEHDDDFGSS